MNCIFASSGNLCLGCSVLLLLGLSLLLSLLCLCVLFNMPRPWTTHRNDLPSGNSGAGVGTQLCDSRTAWASGGLLCTAEGTLPEPWCGHPANMASCPGPCSSAAVLARPALSTQPEPNTGFHNPGHVGLGLHGIPGRENSRARRSPGSKAYLVPLIANTSAPRL